MLTNICELQTAPTDGVRKIHTYIRLSEYFSLHTTLLWWMDWYMNGKTITKSEPSENSIIVLHWWKKILVLQFASKAFENNSVAVRLYLCLWLIIGCCFVVFVIPSCAMNVLEELCALAEIFSFKYLCFCAGQRRTHCLCSWITNELEGGGAWRVLHHGASWTWLIYILYIYVGLCCVRISRTQQSR